MCVHSSGPPAPTAVSAVITTNMKHKMELMAYLSLKNITSPRTVVIASKTRLLSHTCGVWEPVGWTGFGEGPKRKRDLQLVLPGVGQLLRGDR